MVVAILNQIFAGHVTLKQMKCLVIIIHVRKHELCNLGNIQKRKTMLTDFIRNSVTKFDNI